MDFEKFIILHPDQLFITLSTQILTPRFESSPAFDQHFRNLRILVNDSIKQLPAYRKYYPVGKAILLPLIYLGLYVFAIGQQSYPLFVAAYVLMGLMVVILFVNLVHDACHHTLFENNRKANERYMFVFDLLGANSYIWRKRHVRLHHNYPNIAGWDSDIEKSDFLKVHPKDKTKTGRRYKKLMVLLYPLFAINWFVFRDFRDFFTRTTIASRLGKIPLMEYVKLIFFKLFFIGYLFVVPVWVTPFSAGQVFWALMVFMVSTGMLGLVVLLPPHVNVYSHFPTTNENQEVGHSWLMHQLLTTNDVSLNNWFSRHVMANFNYHLIHHLFPKVNYVYAREATDALKQYCLREGLPYRSLPLGKALVGHFKLILRNQLEFNVFEEDM